MKKVIVIMLVMIITVCCTACTTAAEVKEFNCPGLIGLNYLDDVKALNDRYVTGEIEPEYTVTMGQIEDYWVVYLEGEVDDELYVAGGFYDHMPSKEEFDILWNNKVPEKQFSSLMEGLGF